MVVFLPLLLIVPICDYYWVSFFFVCDKGIQVAEEPYFTVFFVVAFSSYLFLYLGSFLPEENLKIAALGLREVLDFFLSFFASFLKVVLRNLAPPSQFFSPPVPASQRRIFR